jgi:hypothetical protein
LGEISEEMKQLFLITTVAMLLNACELEEPTYAGECIEVKYVTGICGQAVLEIQDPAYYHLGETWNGNNHVFYTLFHCDDMEKSTEGTFLITIQEAYEPGSCAVCLAMLDYTGEKRYDVRRVDVCAPEEVN